MLVISEGVSDRAFSVEVVEQAPDSLSQDKTTIFDIAPNNFRDIETTLEFSGCHVQFSARRRPAPEGLEIDNAVELFIKKLRERHAELTLVRQAEALLAGHPAISLDYQFNAGQERRHGRAVCMIIASADGNKRQWLNVSTVINPDQSQLADWLIAFDAMLAGVTAQ